MWLLPAQSLLANKEALRLTTLVCSPPRWWCRLCVSNRMVCIPVCMCIKVQKRRPKSLRVKSLLWESRNKNEMKNENEMKKKYFASTRFWRLIKSYSAGDLQRYAFLDRALSFIYRLRRVIKREKEEKILKKSEFYMTSLHWQSRTWSERNTLLMSFSQSLVTKQINIHIDTAGLALWGKWEAPWNSSPLIFLNKASLEQ